MKKLLYILLFVPFALFGQDDLLLNYMNCIESYEQEVSSIQSQIIEKSNSLDSTQTQFLEVLAYCNMYSVEEQIYDYCYSEVVSSFGVILDDLDNEISYLQYELYSIQNSFALNIPCGDNPFDICMYILCEDTYDSTTINADFDCINPEHILGYTGFCCTNYFCGMPGCKDISACNYDDNAEVNDGSCIYSIGDCVENTIDKWYLSRDLESGWNMFGYGCPEPIDVAEYLSSYTDNIIIAKDNNGAVYIPEWGFNGIGDFTPGFGYQIKVTEAIEGFSLCDWYSSDLVDGSVANIENENIILNSNNSNLLDSLVITQSINTDLQQDIELTILQNNILLVLVQSLNQVLEENVLFQDSLIANIVSLQEENASLQELNNDILSSNNNQCVENGYCGYNLELLACYHPEFGFACNGDSLDLYLGQEAYGGIVFYIDNSGVHGLVGAMEDLGNLYWGCSSEEIVGADGVEIGTGYQNTLDIVAGCSETPIAASEALAYESGGYSDWYLPSRDELVEMYSVMGNGGSFQNLGGQQSLYGSSSEGDYDSWWLVDFGNDGYCGYGGGSNKHNPFHARAIRSF